MTNRRIASIILAAGKGTRMRAAYLHKVCFPVDGKPVIAGSIETYQRCGVDPHCVVVGALAEQVMQAASSVPANLIFCHQVEQRGTGNAAKVAAKALSSVGYDGDVLVVAGDKVLEESILTKLIDTFYENNSDLAFVVGEVDDFPSSGRIICDEKGSILGNVEVFDIARAQLLQTLRRIASERMITPQEAESLALAYFKREKKAALALGSLWEAVKLGDAVDSRLIESNFDERDFDLQIDGRSVSTDLLPNVKYANLSVYMFKAKALYAAVDLLRSDNAQKEEYLTDTIGILASEGRRLDMVPLKHPNQAMAFNTPEELREIEEYVSSRKRVDIREPSKRIRNAKEWLRAFDTVDPAAVRCLSDIYGEGHANVETKRRLLVSMLKNYIGRFGDEPVLITRAPGRVNIMGRHVDHQGGHGNMIGIDRDFYLIAGPRDDRQILLSNLESHQFADRHFNIDALMADYHGGDWLDFVDSEPVKERVASAHGDWMQYVIAPIVRLQAECPDRQLKGMNMLGTGNVPIAAGLSSSSTIVVSTAEAVVRANEIGISPERFVELCGEGEWYVGTRGGAGDHAAMKFARRGESTQVGFFPFGVTDSVQFPTDYLFVVCNSHEKARKTVGAKNVFNHRVACYHIGRELFKQAFPEYASAVQHLRDINTRTLGIGYGDLLRMLKPLPVSITRQEVVDRLPHVAERYLASHGDALNTYPVRSVVVFGLAECERSRTCVDLLRRGDMEQFGRWMNISHNGDRVVMWDHSGNSRPFVPDYSDAALDDLAAGFDQGIEKSTLVLQPGAYACSIPQIDKMADIAISVDGVLGAQMLGAGLGGCVLALVRADAYEALERAMVRGYYEPANLEPELFPCYPVAGSGALGV